MSNHSLAIESDAALEPGEAIRASPVFAGLRPEAIEALARETRILKLSEGASLLPDIDEPGTIYLVLGGRLTVADGAAGGRESLIRRLLPGDAFVQYLPLDEATIRAESAAILGVIDSGTAALMAGAYPELLAARERLQRRELLCRLHTILGPLAESALAELETAVRWIHLNRGEDLYPNGEWVEAVYLVISGRVRATVRDGEGRGRILFETGRGDNVGAAEFFSGARLNARVSALRDTVLIELSYPEFEALLARHPQLLRHLARRALERAHRPAKQANATGRVVSAAVIPVSDGIPVREFNDRLAAEMERFGPVLRLDAERVEALMGRPGITQAPEGSADAGQLLAWLEAREAEHRFLLYEADEAGNIEWTRRCSRLADRILLVADFDAPPTPGPLEMDLFFGEHKVSEAHEVLLLTHRDSSCPPRNTKAWLAERPHLDEYYHVRWDHDNDFGRVARVLAGQAVGLVLGGGGARGFAHIGVLRALERAGVPIDFIGGTSMGAALAAQYALGSSPAEMEAINRRVWVEIRPHTRVTLPIISLVASKKAKECGRMMYGEAEIEDLWTPFFCISSDLTTARMVVHRGGSLLRAASASASLPVFAEPVIEDNRLLVDGALLNNVPADVMRSIGAGLVIACEVSVEDDAMFVSERIPSPWEVLRGKARFPSMGNVLMRSVLLHSTARERSAIREADLCLQPPVDAFGLMDFARLSDLVEVGREYAESFLSTWTDRPAWLPRPASRAREAASARSVEDPPTSAG